MTSIRTTLILRLVGGTFLLMGLVALVVGGAIHHRLNLELNRTLETRAMALGALLRLDEDELEFDFEGDYSAQFENLSRGEYFEIHLPDGKRLTHSSSLGDKTLFHEAWPEDEITFRNLTLPGGEDGRMALLRTTPLVEDAEKHPLYSLTGTATAVEPPSVPELLIVATLSRKEMTHLLHGLYGLLLGGNALLLVFLVALIHATVQRGLQPLETINAQLTTIDPEQLDTRIRLFKSPAELCSVRDTLNQLLKRLQDSFLRERRFSSDVAHELRTPVTELLTTCEVAGRWPENPEDTRAFFADVRDSARQMDHIVSTLLELTRSEGQSEALQLQPFNLLPLLNERLARKAMRFQARNIQILRKYGNPAQVISDHGKLGMVFDNLIDNAAEYAPDDSTFILTVQPGQGHLDVLFTNSAPDLEASDLPRLFDRFWRHDDARGDRQHIGLGLSIVKALCHRLEIDMHGHLLYPGLLEIRLRFPRSSEAKDPALSSP